MSISVVLLVILQAFWLRAEYRSASDNFRRETNLVFRNTIFQITDSIISDFMQQEIETDSPASGRRSRFARFISERRDSMALEDKSSDLDTIQLKEADADNDSSATGFSFEMIHADTLAGQYQEALRLHDIHLPMKIIKKKAVRMPPSYHERDSLKDSLPYATNFVPLGTYSYAADFRYVRPMVIRSLFPQIGFSLFSTLLIVLSFILVSRSLRSQQRLIDQKNDFIGNITHELKTPVATTEAALEAMKHFDVLKNPKQTNEYLDMATIELRRLGMITDKILKTSVFDYEEDIRLHATAVDLEAVARQAMESFRLQASHKGTSLVLNVEGPVVVSGHESHLLQMIYNLLDNAMKYASGGPEVTIQLTGTDEKVTLAVCDKGPGIPEAHQKKIFDKFYRLPSGNVHNVKGYGLGLHYVKGVVKAHGGRITLESSPGKGACFIVKLPAYE